MKRLFLACALFSCAPIHAAPVCISGATLASYEDLGTAGCNIGALTLKGFEFDVLSVGGGAVPVSAGDITVTIFSSSVGPGLQFASPGFRVNGDEFANYLIAYTWDPTGDIRGASDVLDPGMVDIVTNGCVGDFFDGRACPGQLFTLHVFQGETSQLTDSITFEPTAILALHNFISLSANGGTAGFDSLGNNIAVPEPSELPAIGIGLALAIAGRRKFEGKVG